MIKIQFDTVNGVQKVEEFEDGVDFLGCFSNHHVSPEFLTYFDKPFKGTRAMEVGDELFAYIAKVYGIH